MNEYSLLTARRGGWYDPALSIGRGSVRLVDERAAALRFGECEVES